MMKPQSNKSLADEKADIKRGLKTSFQEGAVWQPIAISWFEKWKTYVNYDDEVPEPRNKDVRYEDCFDLLADQNSRCLTYYLFLPLFLIFT